MPVFNKIEGKVSDENKAAARVRLNALGNDTRQAVDVGLAGVAFIDASSSNKRGQWGLFKSELQKAESKLARSSSRGASFEVVSEDASWLRFVIHHAAIYAAKGNRNIISHYNTLVDHYHALVRLTPTTGAAVNHVINEIAEDFDEAVTGCCGFFKRSRPEEKRHLVSKSAADIADKYHIPGYSPK